MSARDDEIMGEIGPGPSSPVDLGPPSEIEDGENIALRRVTTRGDSGLPTSGTLAESPPRSERRGLLGALRSTFANYRDIRRTPYGLTPLLVLGGISFLGQFDDKAFSVAGPFIVRDLEVKITDVTSLSSIVGVLTLLAALFFGWLLDRHRRVPYIAAGTIFSGVFSMVTSRARSLFGYGMPRILDNVADEVGALPRFSLLADYYPPEARGKVFALLGTMRRTGALTSIFVVGILIDRFGWRTATLTFGVPLILMGLVSLVVLREPKRGYFERLAVGATDDEARTEDEPQSFGEGFRATFAVRTLRRLFIADCFTNGGDRLFTLFAAFFLVDRYNLSAFQLALFGLPQIVFGIIGGVYGGTLIDRLTRTNPGRVLTLQGAFAAVSALGVLGFAFGPPLPILLAFSAVQAFGGGLIGPATSAVYSQVIPASIRTQGLQVTNLALLPGLIIFTPLANAVFSTYGYRSVFLFAVPFLLVGAVIATTAGSYFDLDVRSAFAASMADQDWRKAQADGNTKLLVCRDVDVAYDGVQVLFGVDFDVEEGEIIALLGTNGAGKSTLLRAISGTSEARSGAIVFDGRDITHMPPHEIAGRAVSHMPGGRGVFPGMTVRDNLMLANWLNDDPESVKQGLSEAMEIFPALRDRLDQTASSLSGGEQQQLSLAQAFLSKPRLLMIDELSLGLSPAVVGQLLEIVKEIHRRGVTIIVVEQSVNVALTIAHKAVFMEKGEVRFFGKTSELLERPDILRAVYVKGTGALTAGAPAGAQRSGRQQRQLDLTEARPALEVHNLTRRYGGITAVDDVSFVLREGEVLGLIGPNGAGKTTVFDLISGFQASDGGSVVFGGVDITSMSPEQRARLGLVRRFQDARLFPALTVFETMLMALEQKLEVKNTILNAVAMPQARRAERRLRVRAERLLELLELQAYRDKFVRELSTGLRRIVDLACVIATEPKVLLLDEPSSGIAQSEAEGLAPLLRRIKFETGCSILIIEHDMPLISAVSDELLALDRGQVVLRGSPDEVLNDERVIESYLGTSEAAVNRSGRST
ncbi:MAG TPA: MFS transporter [Acidimicrobiales bacterium]|nr:MFS transporter [Acidimicrobiales bacterium]